MTATLDELDQSDEDVGDLPDILALPQGTLASFPGPVVLVTHDGSVLDANAAAEPLSEFLVQGHAPHLAETVAHALRSGHSVVETVTLPTPSGETILQVIVLPLADEVAALLAYDVSLERNLRLALLESRQRYKDLVEASSDFAWETGSDGCFVFVSPRGALGYPADQLVGRNPREFLIDQSTDSLLLPFTTHEPLEGVEIWMRCADGSAACVTATSVPLADAKRQWRGARGVCQDVTDQRHRDTALANAHQRERLLTYIVRTVRDVVEPSKMLAAAATATANAFGATCHIFRDDGPVGRLNLAAEGGTMTGMDPSPILEQLMLAQDHIETQSQGFSVLAAATRYRGKANGAVCLWRASDGGPWSEDDSLLIDEVANQLGIANEQITNHERILELSRTDGLTSLLNRRAFFDELSRRFPRMTRDNQPGALVYVDLDNFKMVNDVHGHQRGDEALLALRDLLVSNTRGSDLLARLGGDEFALWLEHTDEKTAIGRAVKILAASQSLKVFSGSPEKPLGCSLGIAVFEPSHAEALEELLARADAAMYEVKHGGKGSYRLAPPATPTRNDCEAPA